MGKRSIFTIFSVFVIFGGISVAENENVWLKKINRQKETIKEGKIIQLNPGIPNLTAILYLENKYQKETKETFAKKEEGKNTRKSVSIISISKPQINSANSVLIKPQPKQPVPSASQTTQKTTQEQTIRLMGYCFFDRDIEIFGFEKMYAMLPCSFEGINQTAQIMGELVPNPRSYSLVFKPLEVYIGPRIYKVVNGYVLSGDRSSVNIASEIDTQAIKKILANAGVDAGEQTAELIKEGAKDAQTSVSINGDVAIKKTEFNIDIIGKSALWTAVASLVKNTADYFKEEAQNIPITYKIYKGSRIWVNINVKPEQTLP